MIHLRDVRWLLANFVHPSLRPSLIPHYSIYLVQHFPTNTPLDGFMEQTRSRASLFISCNLETHTENQTITWLKQNFDVPSLEFFLHDGKKFYNKSNKTFSTTIDAIKKIATNIG